MIDRAATANAVHGAGVFGTAHPLDDAHGKRP